MIFNKNDMLEILDNFHSQLEDAYSLGHINLSKDINKIIVTGMGGSSFSGEILRCYLEDIKSGIPVYINRDYSLPSFVDQKTLVFVTSYSGNTEETISSYRIALRKSAQIVVITTGGKLKELADKNKNHIILIKPVLMPRLALGYLLIPMINVLRYSRICDQSILKSDLLKTIKALRNKDFNQKGKDFAERLFDKKLIVYSSQRLDCIAHLWKKVFNENAKVMVHTGTFPEVSHNEIESFISLKRDNFVVIIKDEDDYHKIKKRMDLSKKMIANYCEMTEFKLTGQNTLSKIITAVYLSEYISYYIAKKLKRDPLKISMVENFKKELKKTI